MTQPFMPKGIKGFQKGHSVPRELRDKISQLQRGRPSHRRGVRNSPETIEKIKAYYIRMTPEEKLARTEKLRLSHIGKKQSPELIKKRMDARKGYQHSEETRKKISDGHRKRLENYEYKSPGGRKAIYG